MANPDRPGGKAIRARLAELVGEQQQLQKALRTLEGLLASEPGAPAEPSASAEQPTAKRLLPRSSERLISRTT